MGAFRRCTNLQAILIPLSVKVTDTDALNNCTYLKTVKLCGGLWRLEIRVNLLLHCCTSLLEPLIPPLVMVMILSQWLTSSFLVCFPSTSWSLESQMWQWLLVIAKTNRVFTLGVELRIMVKTKLSVKSEECRIVRIRIPSFFGYGEKKGPSRCVCVCEIGWKAV